MPAARLDRARAALSGHALDALVISHPPNIRYLTGLQASIGDLVLANEGCILSVDGRYAAAAAALPGAGTAFTVVPAPGSLDHALVAALRPSAGGRIGVEADYISAARLHRITSLLAQGGGGTPELVHASGLVEGFREVKDADEIRILREAGARLSAVARRARDFVREGRSELDVAADVDAAVRAAGFERAAFETIVASGPNGALPHARPTRRRLSRGDGVVLDFGGVYDGYCVDLTRTLHFGPMPDGFRRLFDAVRDAHAAAVQAVHPGALPAAIDAAARAALERQGLGEAFAHGTGHGLGLEVHEAPRISKVSPATGPIAAGMVFTIEPGAYVPGTGGVRIEDDVLVTDGGCELLTHVPIEL